MHSTTTPMNRLGLDYRAEAARFDATFDAPITDVHLHIAGPRAARIFHEVCDLYRIDRVYTMSRIDEVPMLKDLFGDRIRFIAVPDYWSEDRRHAHGPGFLEHIERFHAQGSRIVKFWSAPRGREYARDAGEPDLLDIDSKWRIQAAELAESLGMMLMVHVADPDTWFAAKYTDASLYGTKLDQYAPLERMLERTTAPWLAAHMGGWPEDLEFLDGLLTRHERLYLDSSATKWMVRELSRHSREDFGAFMRKWSGRILFGSDIVTTDDHLTTGEDGSPKSTQASGAAEAFDLYASRYWALRTLFETEYEGESNIVDPDLPMVDPDRYDENAAPTLKGHALPRDLLQVFYHDAAANLFDPLHAPSCR
jgi:hypothetical protein